MSVDGPRDRATTSTMERVTIRVPDVLLEDVDELAEDGHYSNRSEAMRDGLRRLVREERDDE